MVKAGILPSNNIVMFLEFKLRYFELIIFFTLWIIAILWFKNSTEDAFPYEPAGLIVGGLIPLVDSLRRFGFLSRVRLSTRNPNIKPWSYSGGKIEKTNITVELIVDNNKEQDLLIRSIDIQVPNSVKNVVGEMQAKIRLVDMEHVGKDAFLPLNVQGKKSKTISVVSTHDAKIIEKYTQAAAVGSLHKVESFNLSVTYTIGATPKITTLLFHLETSQLFDFVRTKYEEGGDHKGIVKLLEKT